MQTLAAFFDEAGRRDIHTLAQYMRRHIDAQWEHIYQQTRDEMVARYPEIGDSVYGIYGAHLFREIHNQLKQIGWRAAPRFPGGFMISREWGDDESDRQRWMWSKVTDADKAAVGTIVTVFYHDHLQVRIPRPFRIHALDVTSKAAVVKALSALSPDFAKSQEASIEIAEYLAQLENEG